MQSELKATSCFKADGSCAGGLELSQTFTVLSARAVQANRLAEASHHAGYKTLRIGKSELEPCWISRVTMVPSRVVAVQS
jgi:hypothetical protein